MIADAIEGFAAQVQRGERDVGSPQRMVVTTVDKRAEGVFAGVSARSVTAVVAECDRLGEGNVQSERPRDGGGDLCNFEGVREARALVIIGKDEHLCLAGESTKGCRVENAVTVAFETRAEGVGLFGSRAGAGTDRAGGVRGEEIVLVVFAFVA